MSGQEFQKLVETVPLRYRGPGGAVAILKEGKVVGQHVWGYADLEKRLPMSADTHMPICSITKQLLCMLIADLDRTLDGGIYKKLAEKLQEILPSHITQDTGLTVSHMCDNHSGLRDYWALSVLWGARPDGPFILPEHGEKMVQRLGSLHFQPGTRYTYSNANFYILARLTERITGQSLGELLAERIFAPAGMTTASLCPDFSDHPSPCVAYEGDESHGFVPTQNKIQWSGDAGAVASLNDMIAYEQYLYNSLADAQSLYRTVVQIPPVDNRKARYQAGLTYEKLHIDGYPGGVPTFGHGGALRGFRSHRRQAPSQGLSVVVMFNHEGDAQGAVNYVLTQALRMQNPQPTKVSTVAKVDNHPWLGTFFDSETQLAIEVTASQPPGSISIKYGGSSETVNLLAETLAQSRDLSATLNGDNLSLAYAYDEGVVDAKRVAKTELSDTQYPGSYRCEEVDSVFHCDGKAGMFYGSFDGFLGEGPAHLMRHLEGDIWVLESPRGLDAPAPGDWTVVFRRNEDGSVVGATVGCWLARKLEFIKQG